MKAKLMWSAVTRVFASAVLTSLSASAALANQFADNYVARAPVPRNMPNESDETFRFVATVLADTDDVWRAIFSAAGRVYAAPTLVIFNGRTFSACGIVEGASGESYCAEDQKVYLDPAFLDELGTRYKAPGDFAEAYAVALGVSYHVQDIFGILPRAKGLGEETNESEAGDRSAELELQATCLPGIWAHEEERRGYLDEGDIDEALKAAVQVSTRKLGTDRSPALRGSPHGAAELRQDSFKRGYADGHLADCDTLGRPRIR